MGKTYQKLTEEKRQKVIDLSQKHTQTEIAFILDLPQSTVSLIITEHLNKRKIGIKETQGEGRYYITEQDIMNEIYPQYRYSDLSESEKFIYQTLPTRKK